jgi:hypothetical protein
MKGKHFKTLLPGDKILNKVIFPLLNPSYELVKQTPVKINKKHTENPFFE